jgi:hypothetical protein
VMILGVTRMGQPTLDKIKDKMGGVHLESLEQNESSKGYSVMILGVTRGGGVDDQLWINKMIR